MEASGGSRARAWAANVQTPLGAAKAASIVAVEQGVREGKTYARIIAAAENESAVHVLAEGHTRATAYLRALEAEDEVEVIVGYSTNLGRWHFF